MVEYFPLLGVTKTISLTAIRRRYRGIVRDVARGGYKKPGQMGELVRELEFFWPPRWEFLNQYRAEELQCNVFGHICPVFFTWEAFTETKAGRPHSRTIPRDMMLKVVRRDNSICQICFELVKDNEVQFDHVIPYSRGGPASVENLRLVHARCNKKKRDSLSEILDLR